MATPELGRLVKVPVHEAWLGEASDFTPWLAKDENLLLLSESIGIELELEAQEKFVGPFRADILCKDTTTGHWVLIENQLEKTDHTHLGQLLTYASGLNAVTIVWIAQRFTEQHRATLDWLNEITDDRFNFFGLEVEVWRIGTSLNAPKFNVVSKPNDWTRSISVAADRIAASAMSETQQRYYEFWTQCAERLRERKSILRPPKPSGENWKRFSIGRSDFAIVAFLNTRDKRIGVQLSLYGDDKDRYFKALESRKREIESLLQCELDWQENCGRKESYITHRRHSVDLTEEQSWNDLHDWLIDRAEAFREHLGPIVQQLDVSANTDPIAAENSQNKLLDTVA